MSTEALADVVITRILPADRGTVWDAWTNPDVIPKWWGMKEGYKSGVVEVNLKVGGRYRLGMKKLETGEDFVVGGRFLEVDAPSRLVYTWQWERPNAKESQVTVELVDKGEETELILTHSRIPDEKYGQDHGRGWRAGLSSLEKLLRS